MKPLFFFFTCIRPLLRVALVNFCLIISLSTLCFSQVDKLKTLEIRASAEGYISNLFTDGNDIKKLKENYGNLSHGLNNLKLVLSDSSNNINKYTIRNQVINQLENQQTFLEDLSKQFDKSQVGEALNNHSKLLNQTKEMLPDDFTMDGLKGILDESKSSFHHSFKEKIIGMLNGTSTDNFF